MEDVSYQKRAMRVLERSMFFFRHVLNTDDFWLVLMVWDSKQEPVKVLNECGFGIKDKTAFLAGKKEDGVVDYERINPLATYYLHSSEFDHSGIEPLLMRIVHNELALEPYTNIKAYWISFGKQPVFLNLFDDRGIEVIVNNPHFLAQIKDSFSGAFL